MTFSWLIGPEQLSQLHLKNKPVLIDVRGEKEFLGGHITDARWLDYGRMVHSAHPVGGLLPMADAFNRLMGSLGVDSDSHVIAYDQGPGAAASRLIWSLNAYGFKRASLLNGGMAAWVEAGFSVTTDIASFATSNPGFALDGTTVVDVDMLKSRINDDSLARLDARTRGEFTGTDVRAKHGGRIPGAIHLEWTDAIDQSSASRLLPDEKLQAMLDSKGITKDQDVVVYCQTHHRSSLSYVMLKHLGYENVSALDGAWSAWGNRDDTPREQG